jgi:hypothetical protein
MLPIGKQGDFSPPASDDPFDQSGANPQYGHNAKLWLRPLLSHGLEQSARRCCFHGCRSAVGRLCASGRLAVPGSDVVPDDDGYCSRNRGRYPAQVAAPDARPALHDREEVGSSDPLGARPEKAIVARDRAQVETAAAATKSRALRGAPASARSSASSASRSRGSRFERRRVCSTLPACHSPVSPSDSRSRRSVSVSDLR